MTRVGGWSLVLGGLGVAWVAGRGELAPPPLDVEALAPWLERRGAVVAVLAIVRLVALAAGVYLVVGSAALHVARVRRLDRAATLLARLVPFALSSLVVASPVPALAQSDPTPSAPPETATMRVLEIDPPTTSSSLPPSSTTMASSAEPPTTVAVTSRADAPPAPPPTVATPAPSSPAPVAAAPSRDGEWVVERGDHFWSIATSVLTDELGRRPTDTEVAPYWRRLVDANRSRLVTGDPDLIYPGQVLTLPPAG